MDSVRITRYGSVEATLFNIKHLGNLIEMADFRYYYSPPVVWKLEYDKRKRPISSQFWERFYYDEFGYLVSYTNPSPSLNSTFESDDRENPMHRIPNLNLILLDEPFTSFFWYNPHNATSRTYADGRKTVVDNRFDNKGNLIASYWSGNGNTKLIYTY